MARVGDIYSHSLPRDSWHVLRRAGYAQEQRNDVQNGPDRSGRWLIHEFSHENDNNLDPTIFENRLMFRGLITLEQYWFPPHRRFS